MGTHSYLINDLGDSYHESIHDINRYIVATSPTLIEQRLSRQTISCDVATSHEGSSMDVFADYSRSELLNS